MSTIRERLGISEDYKELDFKEEKEKLSQINKSLINTKQKNTSELWKNAGVNNYLPTKIQINNMGTNYTSAVQNISSQRFDLKRQVDNLPEIKQLEQQRQKQESNTGWAEYYKNLREIENKDISWWDKYPGRFLSGPMSTINALNDYKYKTFDENGNRVYLPSKYDLKEQKINESYNSGLGRFIGNTLSQISKIGTSSLVNTVAPGVGSATYWGSMFTQNLKSAKQDGYEDMDALLYATTSSALEFATSKVLGSATNKLTGGKSSALDQQLKKGFSKLIKNETVSNFLANATSEGIEEFTQEYLDNFNKLIFLEKSKNPNDYLDVITSTDVLSDALYSAGIGAISGGVLGGNIETNNKTLPMSQETNLQDIKALQNTQYSKENDINQNIENSNIFKYNKTDNQKVNNLMESAVNSQFSDTQTTHNFINSLAKIITDKDIDIVFDNTLQDDVNGKYENGKISINPNSTRAGEFIAIHELTHAIGTDTMRNIVDKYRQFNTEFNDYLQTKLNNYKTSELSEEAMSDVLGNVLGNQEYINNLSIEEPNIFKKIYQEVKYLYHQLRGYKNQSQFVEDLMYKFDSAYRNSDINLDKTGFSIQTDENGNKYVNVDTDQDIFEGINTKDYNKIAKMYINDYLRGETNLSNNDKAIIDSKSASKYTNPGKKQPNFIEKMKLTPELKNVLEISQKNSASLPIKDTSKYSKWEYYKFNFKIGTQDFTGVVNIGIDNNGKKHFYEVNNIQKTSGISDVSPNRPTGSYSNTIPLSNENVNTTTNYSMQNDTNNTDKWQKYLVTNFKPTGTRTNMQDIKLPIPKEKSQSNKMLPTSDNLKAKTETKKTMDPVEISKLTKEDASTTPTLSNYNAITGDGESKFYTNATEKSKFLKEDVKNLIKNEDDIKYYKEITNKETLEKAYKKLQDGGANETLNWFNRNGYDENGKYKYKPTAEDVAEGWILMKQYQDAKDYDMVVNIAKKMREIGTQAGQTVQAFGILERLTPEGMVKYAQSELLEAYDKMVKNKSKEWIDKHKSDFDLKPNEVEFIINNMKEVSKMEDGYDKRVKLAEIQKLMTDKLPLEKGKAIKSWMRISMLFNPKTQVRNVVGNALIMPINNFSDLFSSYTDKLISKKTGVRTTGNVNVKAQLKGFKEGFYQATNDYKKGINTKDMEGNRFEIGEGKSFNDKKLIGKSLNRVEGLLNYVMDVGDRMFSQSAFENSLQNQLKLNNTTEITPDMIDIARTESLQRTWNDNNNYTKFVLDIRRGINKFAHYGNYGLGDILIPFAKTPANLTKAIVDYSPVGLVNTLIQGNNLRKALNNGQYTPQMQHKFVQTLGKATAGSLLYIMGIGLAKAGITTGESDEDKDTANFLKNTLGVSSYSINIGGKSFTYDWAQPLAAPLSITANVVNSKNKKESLLESIVGNLDTAGSVLLEQSFLTSLNEVFSDNDGPISGIINQFLNLPARAVPTFSKQIVDLTDCTQRTSYEYGKPLESAVNSIKAKIPGLSKTLAPSVDTLGREIQRYGGKNNIFNVFLNPANITTENISESAKEIYVLYKETGDKTIMPRVTPYYINTNGEKITLTSKEKAEYQKISGSIIEENVKRLLNDSNYKKLSSSEKANLIKNIVDYSYNKARKDVTGIPIPQTYNKISEYTSQGGKVSDYYLKKDEIDYSLKNPKKHKIITQIATYDKYLEYKEKIDAIKETSNNKKTDIIKYVNSLKMSIPQKAMLIKMYYSSFKVYDDEVINYIKKEVKNMNEREEILKELGFTVKDGRVYK